jgi:hypothetical protein
MNNSNILTEFKYKKVKLISQEEFDIILKQSKIVKESNTMISGLIRILLYNRNILVQETTPKDEIAVRFMESEGEANEFVEKRMVTYEKMWDGCGCKVDYYS